MSESGSGPAAGHDAARATVTGSESDAREGVCARASVTCAMSCGLMIRQQEQVVFGNYRVCLKFLPCYVCP